MASSLDAIVIGSGPNGLAAAITLAQAGKSVRVYEAQPSLGGAMRSDSLTDTGFIHDVCSTVHAFVPLSPFFKSLPLQHYGFELLRPDAPLAHPFDDGSAVVVERDVDATAESLGLDGVAYRKLIGPLVRRSSDLMPALLAPIGRRPSVLLARFGVRALRSAAGLARAWFSSERAQAVFGGAAAHSLVPLEYRATAAFGLALIVSAHATGWPVAKGGSQTLAYALAAHLRQLGGDVVSNSPIGSLRQLPKARAVLCDVTPRQFVRLAGDRLNPSYRRRLERFRYGPGVFKMDWALHQPVPWKARECARAGTIHLGGTLAEICDSERAAWLGGVADAPYVLLVQPTIVDRTRAPDGMHTLWAYCHVPHGSDVDMSDRVERQIERFAPGFRDCIRARHVMGPSELERRNANLVGGDIAGGAADLAQLFTRPVASLNPYATPLEHVYLCSSSTPPGMGVHGMCGYHAARAALRHSFQF
jgi:phytoene dehydrogenase-like protein